MSGNAITFRGTWKGVRSGPPGLQACPGRNDPRYGSWMIEALAYKPRWRKNPDCTFCGSDGTSYLSESALCSCGSRRLVIADPMCGGGQLWMMAPEDATVHGCERNPERVPIAQANGILAVHGDALTWRPPERPDLVGFSFSFPNCDHVSGKGEMQRAFIASKGLQSMQRIEPPPDLLRTYLQIATYCGAAPVATIVKNWIEEQAEVDWTSEVVAAANWAGFDTEVFSREITPGFTEVAKRASGKLSPRTGQLHRVVTRENVVVARLRR